MKLRQARCERCKYEWIVRKKQNCFIECPRCQKVHKFDIVKDVEI